MRILLFLGTLFLAGVAFSQGSDMSKADLSKYLKDCKKMILQSQPNKDPKDVDMLCRDPYLKGTPNESKENKARRERLLKESDISKEKAFDKFIDKTSTKQSDLPEEMSKEEYDGYMKACKKMILESDPGKEPKDVDMLCSDPYLNGKPDESYDDQVRRKRLIKEADKAKHKAFEKYVTPASSGKPASNDGSK